MLALESDFEKGEFAECRSVCALWALRFVAEIKC